MRRTLPDEDAAVVRRVLAFADAAKAPPEAIGWLLQLAEDVETKRAAGAREVSPLPLSHVAATSDPEAARG